MQRERGRGKIKFPREFPGFASSKNCTYTSELSVENIVSRNAANSLASPVRGSHEILVRTRARVPKGPGWVPVLLARPGRAGPRGDQKIKLRDASSARFDNARIPLASDNAHRKVR